MRSRKSRAHRVNKEDIFKPKEAKLAKEGTRDARRRVKLGQLGKKEAPLAGQPAAIP
jgi:hypothetical protein